MLITSKKYMEIGGRNYDEAQRQLLAFEIEGIKMEFETVQTFIFLGVRITEKYDEGQEIEAKLAKGDRWIAGLRKLLNSKNLAKKKHKPRIYKTVIRPTVTYVSESWVLNTRRKSTAGMGKEVSERNICRTKANGVYGSE